MLATEMIQQVADELRNTKIDSKILRWLNIAQNELATQYVFDSLHRGSNASTSTGSNSYPMQAGVPSPSNTEVAWIKRVTLTTGTQERKLLPIYDIDSYIDRYPTFRTEHGYVTHYYYDSAAVSDGTTFSVIQTTLHLWRLSSVDTDLLIWEYQQMPVSLLLGGSCVLPVQWHSLVCQMAVTQGNRYDGNSTGIQESLAAEMLIQKRIGANHYKRPDESVVVGINNQPGKRMGRPQFPSNFPRVW